MKHLSEAALHDLLMGEGTRESVAHVAECAPCRQELGDFRALFGVFNETSTLWSEAKSNGLSRDLSKHTTPFRVSSVQAYSFASLLLLVVAGASTLAVRTHEPGAQVAARMAPSVLAGQMDRQKQEIASDNAMLEEIDSAVNAPVSSPMTVYGVGQGGGVQPVGSELSGQSGQEKD